MFELNFRDERYLPFEGAGAISRWRIDLPQETNAFDFNTLTDVVLLLKYTAREGGDILRNAALKALEAYLEDDQNVPLARMFSLKHEFPTDWYRWLHSADLNAPNQALTMALGYERFPFRFRGKTIQFSQVDLFLNFKDASSLKGYQPLPVSLSDGSTSAAGTLDSDSAILGGMPRARLPFASELPPALSLSVAVPGIEKLAESVEDLFVVCPYTIV
jgi:hypothetical protein